MDHVLAWTIRMIFWNLCSSYGPSTHSFNHQNDALQQILLELSEWFIRKNVVLILWKVSKIKRNNIQFLIQNLQQCHVIKLIQTIYRNISQFKPNRTPFSSANYVYFTNFSWTHSCAPNNITTVPPWPRKIVNWKKRFHNKGTTMHLLSVLPFTRLLSQPKMEYAHMDHARSTQRIKKFNEQDKWKSKKADKTNGYSENLRLEPPGD